MKKILTDIQEGRYAQGWIDENKKGRPWFNKIRQSEQEQTLEKVGADLREMMPFIDPVRIKPGE